MVGNSGPLLLPHVARSLIGIDALIRRSSNLGPIYRQLLRIKSLALPRENNVCSLIGYRKGTSTPRCEDSMHNKPPMEDFLFYQELKMNWVKMSETGIDSLLLYTRVWVVDFLFPIVRSFQKCDIS